MSILDVSMIRALYVRRRGRGGRMLVICSMRDPREVRVPYQSDAICEQDLEVERHEAEVDRLPRAGCSVEPTGRPCARGGTRLRRYPDLPAGRQRGPPVAADLVARIRVALEREVGRHERREEKRREEAL